MARIVKEAEYTARRNEILNAAQNLIYSKGYEQMTIQDILDSLQISRGALYHYFDSKQALLEALIDRMGKEAVQTFLPYVMDPELTAIEKLNCYFEASVRWKTAQKELILNLLHIWYSNDNAFIRQKMTTESLKVSAGLVFEPILRQGIEEEVFSTRFPRQSAQILAGVALSLTDSIIELLLSPGSAQTAMQELETILEAYFDSIERILGVPAGSLKRFDADAFQDWLAFTQPESVSGRN